jgi:hypothetical protein
MGKNWIFIDAGNESWLLRATLTGHPNSDSVTFLKTKRNPAPSD